jgi:hypothetical protein
MARPDTFPRPFQVAIQVRAALGSDPAREQIRKMTRGPGGRQMNAAELRQRMTRTIPNRFRRTLELNDSLALALTPEQWGKLRPNVKNPLMGPRGQQGEGGVRIEMHGPPPG